jgi:hypothetical protein
MFNDQLAYEQFARSRMAENATVEARAKKDALRDRRVDILAAGIDEAIRRAPDAFGGRVNPRRAAMLVVDAYWPEG